MDSQIAQEIPKEEILVSFTVIQHPTTKFWSVLELHTQGDKVVKTKMTEPNFRNIALEELKIAVVKKFIYEGNE
jgi:hypothetical protein